MNAVWSVDRARHHQCALLDGVALALGQHGERPYAVPLRAQQGPRNTRYDYRRSYANDGPAGVQDDGHFVGPTSIPRASLILQGEYARAGDVVDDTADNPDAQPGHVIDEQGERVRAEPQGWQLARPRILALRCGERRGERGGGEDPGSVLQCQGKCSSGTV